jgi:ketosteroid isomerase-like protein
MTTSVSHELVHAFFQARLSYDPAKIAAVLDDDIEWSMSGPVDLLRYAGQRRGKQAVIDTLITQGLHTFKLDDLTIDDIVVEGNTAITLTRVIAVQANTGRKISYSCAQLLRFRGGKLVEFRCINDSFDAAEQVLGREIDVSDAPRPVLSRSAV